MHTYSFVFVYLFIFYIECSVLLPHASPLWHAGLFPSPSGPLSPSSVPLPPSLLASIPLNPIPHLAKRSSYTLMRKRDLH